MKKIIVLFRVPDMSSEKYDSVMKDLSNAGKYSVKKRTHHVMALAEKGSIVADVWESHEDLNEFFGTLGPILVKNGVNPPQPEIYPIHNIVV